nr:putative NADH:ubiquinone reductase [Tanacetum cinerariifolium]
MAMRSSIISRSSALLTPSMRSSSVRLFSDQGRVLSEEERAAENVYIKKMEKEQLEKKKLKEAKEKAEKEKAEKKP